MEKRRRIQRKRENASLYGEKKQKNQRCLAGWLGCFSSPVLSLLLDFVRSSVRVGSRAAFIGSLQLASPSVCMTKTGKRPSREAARLRRNAPTLVLRAKDDRNAAYWEDSEILRRQGALENMSAGNSVSVSRNDNSLSDERYILLFHMGPRLLFEHHCRAQPGSLNSRRRCSLISVQNENGGGEGGYSKR